MQSRSQPLTLGIRQTIQAERYGKNTRSTRITRKRWNEGQCFRNRSVVLLHGSVAALRSSTQTSLHPALHPLPPSLRGGFNSSLAIPSKPREASPKLHRSPQTPRQPVTMPPPSLTICHHYTSFFSLQLLSSNLSMCKCPENQEVF